jgi:dTDP-4-dehydrorhamnose reductase
LTGAGGMLGTDLRNELLSLGETVIAFNRAELDVSDSAVVTRFIREHRPDVIVNCAAYTKVDLAETEVAQANAINGSAVEHLAAAANAVDALLVQVSTDFVFDGSKRTPYEVNDPTNPLSIYGSSKLIGEDAARTARKHLIVRTSWLFGTNGPNFVEAIRNQIRKGTNPLRVVNDQHGRPTYTPHLATAIVRLARQAADAENARGIVHYADDEACSWFDFARAIAEGEGSDVEITPVTSAEFVRPATRPAYSVLSTERYERLTGVTPDSWRDGLREYLTKRP